MEEKKIYKVNFEVKNNGEFESIGIPASTKISGQFNGIKCDLVKFPIPKTEEIEAFVEKTFEIITRHKILEPKDDVEISIIKKRLRGLGGFPFYFHPEIPKDSSKLFIEIVFETVLFFLDDLFIEPHINSGKMTNFRQPMEILIEGLRCGFSKDLGLMEGNEIYKENQILGKIYSCFQEWHTMACKAIENFDEKFADTLTELERTLVQAPQWAFDHKDMTRENFFYLRKVISCGMPCFKIGCVLEDVFPTEKHRENLIFQQFTTLLGNIVAYTNDLLSLYNELKEGEIMNIVLWHLRQGMDIQSSIDKVVEIINEGVKSFIQCADRLTKFEFPGDETMEKYVRIGFQFLDGHVQYYGQYINTRYPIQIKIIEDEE